MLLNIFYIMKRPLIKLEEIDFRGIYFDKKGARQEKGAVGIRFLHTMKYRIGGIQKVCLEMSYH